MFVDIAWKRSNRYIRVRFPLSWRREFPRKFDRYQYRDAPSSNILSSLWVDQRETIDAAAPFVLPILRFCLSVFKIQTFSSKHKLHLFDPPFQGVAIFIIIHVTI